MLMPSEPFSLQHASWPSWLAQGENQLPVTSLTISASQENGQEEPSEDGPLKNIFDRLWTNLDMPDDAARVPPNEPLLQEMIGPLSDMEPLRMFAPGADGFSDFGEEDQQPYGDM